MRQYTMKVQLDRLYQQPFKHFTEFSMRYHIKCKHKLLNILVEK